MRSSLIEARPASSAHVSHTRPVPNPQRSPMPPPATPAKKRKRISLVPSEGWMPLLLLAVAVYSVVYSVTAAIAISHTGVLWATTALGLICGLVVSKSRLFPQAVLHIAACILGYWLALMLTSSLAYHVSLMTILGSLHTVITNGFSLAGTPESDMIFLFYLAFLCFFLGYFGAWLIYRAHLPWLVALVYVSIMIVNLNYIAKRDLTFLVIILVAALIPLIARVQLAGQLTQWRNEGLYTDQVWLRNLTTRFLRIVCLFALIILPLSWLLPVISQPSAGVTFWDRLDNAWANISHGNLQSLTSPNSLFSPYQPASNFFGDQLSITGSVNLPDGPVISYTSTSPTMGFYLEGFSFDTFDGHTWSSQLQSPQNYSGNSPIGQNEPGLMDTNALTTTITILQPPGGTKHFIFAPADPNKFTVPITLLTDPTGTIVAAWTQTTALQQNERYQVLSNVSAATPAELSHVSLPGANLGNWASIPDSNTLQQYYLAIPQNSLSPEVLATAKKWTQGANTLYETVAALQSHLSNQAEFTYSVSNPPVPSNIDAVTWLLHTHRGYCTYYATAMVMMARQLGIPARIVNGFSQGHYNIQQKAWVVNGSDAHSWVQVYFPDFGWMNFDPTPGFSVTNAGMPAPSPTAGATKPPTTKSPTATPPKKHTPTAQPTATLQHPGDSTNTPGPTDTSGVNLFLTISLIILFGSCGILGFAVMRYRRKGLASKTAIASVYTRLCRLARLVGSPPASWQTPYEYTFTLSKRYPQASAALRRLADLFVRERWASPQQAPAPHEQQELERLWPRLRNTLLRSRFSKGR